MGARKGGSEQQMFGGVGFLGNGYVCGRVHRSGMMARLDPKATESELGRAHTREFDLTGRPMRGWILVSSEGLSSEDDVAYWVGRGFEFASTLPGKSDA